MKTISYTTHFFLLSILLLLCTTTSFISARPGSSGPFDAELKSSKGSPAMDQKGGGGGGSDGDDNGMGGFFGPGGGGFGIPGFGPGWAGGYGAGYGGPSGGYAKGGVVRPTVVCKEKGPCHKKKLTCPANCFTSYSRSGKGYGAGGGGGGCTVDCKNKCIAYC